MHPKVLLFLALITFPFLLSAQKTTLNQKAFKTLKNHFHKYVEEGSLAGSVIFLEKNGLLTKDVFGYQNLETKVPMSENSIFRWASMTKPIIATAILQLAEKEKLDLDDPVALYIPKVSQMNVYDGTPNGRTPENTMTILHLLSHTSGSTSAYDFSLAGKAASNVLRKKEAANLNELVDAITETQLSFEPGEGWAYGYSNDLLAAIIEKVSGMSVEVYLSRFIFEPLEMNKTSFVVKDAQDLTSVYAPDQEGELKVIETNKKSRYVNGENFARGNGGLAGPAGDYLNFCRMILNKGTFNGKRLLKQASVELMMKNSVVEKYFPLKVASNELTGHGYGLGFGVIMNDAPLGTPGDVYWPGSLFTFFFISPEHQSIGIFMIQLRDLSRMGLIWEFYGLATEAVK